MLGEDRAEVGVRVPLVQEERLAQLGGERELGLERAALVGARREVAEVVEPAFAQRDEAGVLRDVADQRLEVGVPVGRVVRMQAGGRRQPRALEGLQGGGPRCGLLAADRRWMGEEGLMVAASRKYLRHNYA